MPRLSNGAVPSQALVCLQGLQRDLEGSVTFYRSAVDDPQFANIKADVRWVLGHYEKFLVDVRRYVDLATADEAREEA